jgi:7-cyano-7-deazaguanosine (preQ0) biosynthesis protein QueE
MKVDTGRAALLATPLLVSEVFGPTVQGEGPAAGRLAWFVRLGGCNLMCSWCDAAYTWDGRRFDLRTELTRHTVAQVLDQLPGRAPLVIITGGEPLLQQHPGYGLVVLAQELAQRGYQVHVETNGTATPVPELLGAVRLFVVSPKLAHAGMPTERTIKRPVLRGYAELADRGQAVLKVVCQSTADVAQAAALADANGWSREQVWIMPEGTDVSTLAVRHHALIDATLARGMNTSTRLHILCYGDRRGT